MCKLNLSLQKRVLTGLKLNFFTGIAILLAFSAKAQLPGQLPVNLKIFKASAVNSKQVKVFWTTEYEKDNGYFDIERSADGVNFSIVGRVPGINNNGHLTDYTFFDNQSMSGISFYRLKQVDIDGKFSFSPIERVRNAETGHSADIYPNPASGASFNINLLKNIPGTIDVLVYDHVGRLKLQQQFGNNNTITVNHHLSAGIYTVKITGKELSSTRQLVIQ
ncbi:MAG: T9SS type A sorting domain-containing protein [Chitinophagaceae bacterium]|nr:T9SS type A sorting domain-containing protein [Chitinophagaceae bacterium]